MENYFVESFIGALLVIHLCILAFGPCVRWCCPWRFRRVPENVHHFFNQLFQMWTRLCQMLNYHVGYKIGQTILYCIYIGCLAYKLRVDMVSCIVQSLRLEIDGQFQFHNDSHQIHPGIGIYSHHYIFHRSCMGWHIWLEINLILVQLIKIEANSLFKSLFMLTKFTLRTIKSLCTLAFILLYAFAAIQTLRFTDAYWLIFFRTTESNPIICQNLTLIPPSQCLPW